MHPFLSKKNYFLNIFPQSLISLTTFLFSLLLLYFLCYLSLFITSLAVVSLSLILPLLTFLFSISFVFSRIASGKHIFRVYCDVSTYLPLLLLSSTHRLLPSTHLSSWRCTYIRARTIERHERERKQKEREKGIDEEREIEWMWERKKKDRKLGDKRREGKIEERAFRQLCTLFLHVKDLQEFRNKN